MTEGIGPGTPANKRPSYTLDVASSQEELPPISVIGATAEESSGHPELPHRVERVSNRSQRRTIALGLLGLFTLLGLVLVGFGLVESDGTTDSSSGPDDAATQPALEEQSTTQTDGSGSGTQPLTGDGPIFPEAQEWAMLARTSRGLVVIDLATGDQRIERTILRHPILVTQDHVVYGQTQTGVLHTAPLNDLGAADRMPGRLLATASSEENYVWVVSEQSDLPTELELSLVDLNTLRVTRRVPSTVVRSSFSRLDAVSLAAPELTTSPAGGTYRFLEDGTYEKVSDGALVTHGHGLALLERCDGELQCEFFWIETATGDELERPVPDSGSGPFVLTGGGQWLVDLGSGRTILNTDSGEVLDLGTRPNEPISVSPDGRYATYRREGGTVLEVMDTATGEVRQVKDLQLLSLASNGVFPPAVFVPTAALAP